MQDDSDLFYKRLETFPGLGARSESSSIDKWNTARYSYIKLLDYYGLSQYVIDGYYYKEYNMRVERYEESETQSSKMWEQTKIYSGLCVSKQLSLNNSDTQNAYRNPKNFLIGWFFIAVMMISNSVVAPLTLSLPAENVFIKASWQIQASAALSVPLMIALYIYKGKKMNFLADHSYNILLRNSINAAFLMIWNLGLLISCSITNTAQAYVLANSSGCLVFFLSVLLCQRRSRIEYFGYFLFVIGICFMLNDSFATKTAENSQQILGSLLAVIGAIGCWAFQHMNTVQTQTLHPITMISQVSFFMFLYQLILFPCFVESYFSIDSKTGAFGWISNYQTLLLLILMIAPVSGVLNNLSFDNWKRYFQIEIIAFSMIAEPFIAQMVVITLGQDNLPSLRTVCGLFILTIGLSIVARRNYINSNFFESKVFYEIDEEEGYSRST